MIDVLRRIKSRVAATVAAVVLVSGGSPVHVATASSAAETMMPRVADRCATLTPPPQAAPPDNRFPLAVASDQRILLDANGAPFLVHGDTAWSMIVELDREEATEYLDARAESGFNALLVNLLEARYTTSPPMNAFGESPFIVPGDYSTPNEAYFEYARWMVSEAGKRGIVVFLAPSYVGIIPEDGWWGAMEAAGYDALRNYGRYVGAMFAGERNVIWVQSGDSVPGDLSLIDAIADGIDEVDPTAVQTAHAAPEHSAAEIWGDRDWLDLNNVYSYEDVHGRSIDQLTGDDRPFVLIESTYENERGATTDLLRAQAYQNLLAGSTGQIFGNNPMWHFDGPGTFDTDMTWREQLNSPGTQSMAALKSVWDQVPWWQLRPDIDQSFVVRTSSADGEAITPAAVSCDGTAAVVYVPTMETSVEVDLGVLAGERVTVEWVDPTSGGVAREESFSVDGDSVVSLTMPGMNAEDDGDWLLIIRTA